LTYLSSRQARERLKLAGLPSSREVFERLVRAGQIEATKAGPYRSSAYRVTEAALADYLQRCAAPVARRQQIGQIEREADELQAQARIARLRKQIEELEHSAEKQTAAVS